MKNWLYIEHAITYLIKCKAYNYRWRKIWLLWRHDSWKIKTNIFWLWFYMYSTDRTQPNTLANPERTRGSLPGFALRSLLKTFLFALGPLWVRFRFATGSLSGFALRTHAWSGSHFNLAASKPRPLYIPSIYTVMISVIVDFVVR
jgi:hypothetical protein